MSDVRYKIVRGVPTAQQYYQLRKDAGLTPPPIEDAEKALAGTWIGYVAVDSENNDNVVSMGRIIGDGALFLDMVDIATHPDHQRRGLSRKVVEALLQHTDKHAPNAYLTLVAEPSAQKIYPKFGFSDVKPSIGMYRCERIRLRKEEALRQWEKTQATARN